MAINVVLICENHRKDPPLIAPIVKALLAAARSGNQRINLVVNQVIEIHGWDQATRQEYLSQVFESYPGAHLYLLCIDRDAEQGRTHRLQRAERESFSGLSGEKVLLAEHAIEEVEVWVLAGLKDLPGDWSWREIREDRDCKEWLAIYARKKQLDLNVEQVRKELGNQAARNYSAIRGKCREDLARLEERVRTWMTIRDGGSPDKRSEINKLLTP
ncbi:MAG: hypothetical protein JJU11_03555 [Candidatus Sumerlaeia bacterium]|nr:hypothetical protein [Candidatus Sumerlaeia bacterium]